MAFYAAHIALREHHRAKEEFAAKQREQKINDNEKKFRFDTAVKAIDLFNKFENEMRDVRLIFDPGSCYAEVLEIRNKNLSWWTELDEIQQLGFIGITRIKKIKSINEIVVLRPYFKIMFKTDKPISDCISYFITYGNVCESAIRDPKSINDTERKILQHDVSDFGPDDFAISIRKMVNQLEMICSPAISSNFAIE